MKLKVVTLFSGYDSQCLSLDRLHNNYPQFDYELVAWSEIDKYAIQAHNAIYPQYSDRNLGDVCKIDWNNVSDFDLLTCSSPCTDFSAAGLQKGGEKGSGTRSSLLWECERAIKEKKPKYLLMENVADLVRSKFIKLFNKWQSTLEGYGYTNYAKVMNAKNYGVPQNRERIFMVSVRNDVNQKFYFPEPFKLDKRLKDILDDSVDEKYYLSERTIKGFLEHNERHIAKGTGFLFQPKNKDEIACCVRSNAALCPTDNILYVDRIGNVNPSGNGMNGEVFSTNGLAPTLTTNKGEGNKILEPKEVIGSTQKNACIGTVNGPSSCITSACGIGGGQTPMITYNNSPRIRKLTPTECFRLMDVDNKDIHKLLNSGISNSQLYKLAGNSIVVSCLYHIFRKLFIEKENENKQLELF